MRLNLGDVYREVELCGIGAGKRKSCRTVMAILDTGATSSVIGSELAEKLHGDVLLKSDEIEGRKVDVMAAEIRVKSRDCGRRRRPVVVDDALAARAGEKAKMILGSDYMQRTKMAILLSDVRSEEGVACSRTSKRKKKR